MSSGSPSLPVGVRDITLDLRSGSLSNALADIKPWGDTIHSDALRRKLYRNGFGYSFNDAFCCSTGYDISSSQRYESILLIQSWSLFVLISV